MNTIPVPKNPLHVKFADFVLNGDKPAKAYQKAGFQAKTAASRATNAGRLLKNADISAYIKAMQEASTTDKVLTLREKREFFARVVRTPLMEIDPHGKDGDLIMKYRNTVTEDGGQVEIVKVDPLKAIEADNKLSGDDPESAAMAGLAEALAGLGGQVFDDRM
jgi:phage terminase small subunit